MDKIENQIEILNDQLAAVRREMDTVSEYIAPWTARLADLKTDELDINKRIQFLYEEEQVQIKDLVRIICPTCKGNKTIDIQLLHGGSILQSLNIDLSGRDCPQCEGTGYLLAPKYKGDL